MYKHVIILFSFVPDVIDDNWRNREIVSFYIEHEKIIKSYFSY